MTFQMRKGYDPDEIARSLACLFASQPPIGLIVGRAMLRDAISQLLECSQLEAEETIDTLILRGRLVFVKPPDELGSWAFRLPGRC